MIVFSSGRVPVGTLTVEKLSDRSENKSETTGILRKSSIVFRDTLTIIVFELVLVKRMRYNMSLVFNCVDRKNHHKNHYSKDVYTSG